jgi:AcrR family transcriptional regulator
MTTPRRDAGRPRGEPIERAILQATLDDLAHHGLGAVSIDRVAAAADVNRTTVYRRWATVDLLVDAALQYAVTQVPLPPIEDASVEVGLLSLVNTVAALLATTEGQTILRAGISPQIDRRAATLVSSAAVAVPDALSSLIEEATARGEWNPELPAIVVVAAAFGAGIHRTMIERQPMDTEWTAQLVGLLMHGIAGAPRADS